MFTLLVLFSRSFSSFSKMIFTASSRTDVSIHDKKVTNGSFSRLPFPSYSAKFQCFYAHKADRRSLCPVLAAGVDMAILRLLGLWITAATICDKGSFIQYLCIRDPLWWDKFLPCCCSWETFPLPTQSRTDNSRLFSNLVLLHKCYFLLLLRAALFFLFFVCIALFTRRRRGSFLLSRSSSSMAVISKSGPSFKKCMSLMNYGHSPVTVPLIKGFIKSDSRHAAFLTTKVTKELEKALNSSAF